MCLRIKNTIQHSQGEHANYYTIQHSQGEHANYYTI